MASRTQLRLQQLTGSVVDVKTEAQHYVTKNTAAALTGSDVQDIFGIVGATLNRIHGAASSEPFNNTAGHFLNAATTDGSDDGGAIKLSASAGGIGLAWADDKNLWAEGGKIMMVANEDDANAIKIHADAGSGQQITVLNDQGTNEAAIALTSTAGGVDIDAAAAKNVDVSGGQVLISSKDNAASAIALTANVGSDETIVVTNTKGTGVGAISLVATVGGVLIDQDHATKKVHVDSEGAVDIDSVKGITITNVAAAGGDDITIENTNAEDASVIITAAGNGTSDGAIQIATSNAAGEITITSAHTAGRALHIDADAAAGSIVDIDAGILDIDVTGVASLDSGGTLSLGVANSGVAVNIGHATSEVTIGQNLTVTGDTTLAGNLIVQGATTTVSSSNMVIQDSIIGLGFSGSDDAGNIFGNAGQRAVIFGKSVNQHDFLPALNYDGTGFVLGTFEASPSSGSMGAAQAGIELRAGHLKPVTSDGATLGDANEMWSDLFLADGGVVNFNNGNFKLTHSSNALTIDTDDKLQFRDSNSFIHSNAANDLLLGATDITLDAAADLILDTTGVGKAIRLKQTGTEYGILSGTLTGETKSLIISSSAGGHLTLDSNSGTVSFANATNADFLQVKFNTNTEIGAADNKDLIFVHDILDDSPVEVFRVDEDAESLLMASDKKIEFRDSGLFINSNADGDLDISSDGTNADAIKVDSAGGITLDADSAVHGITYADGNTAMLRITNVSSDATIESLVSNKDMLFKVNDGGASAEVFRLDADNASATSNAPALLMNRTKQIRFNDHKVALGKGGTDQLQITSNNITFLFPTARATESGQALVGDGSGNLSFASVASATSKAIRIVTGSGFATGATVDLGPGNVRAGSAAIQDLALSDAQGDSLDVFVNGQMLLSGSEAQIIAATADFMIDASGSISFGFALEADDIIQVCKR